MNKRIKKKKLKQQLYEIIEPIKLPADKNVRRYLRKACIKNKALFMNDDGSIVYTDRIVLTKEGYIPYN